MKKHSKQWFINRIWKRVYRWSVDCKCITCTDVEKDWVEIYNESHADYLYTVQYDLQINYFNKPLWS